MSRRMLDEMLDADAITSLAGNNSVDRGAECIQLTQSRHENLQ